MVNIITLNYNQNDYTLKCVESLTESNFEEFLILVVDNGSDMENYQNLKKQIEGNDKVELLRLNKNIGYVGGINHGLKNLDQNKCEYVLILNNDTIIDANAIKYLVDSCIQYANKAIVTGKVYNYGGGKIIQDVGYTFKNKNTLSYNRLGLNEEDIGQFDKQSERDMIDDVFWLFSIDLYKEIGGYSNYFWFNGEQADFALRAKNNGYKLVFNPKAIIHHKGSVSIGGRDRNPKLVYFSIQSSLILRFIHLKTHNFLLFYLTVLYSIILSNIKGLFYMVKGDPGYLRYAKGKNSGHYYFLRWLIKRNPNNGKIGF